MAELRGSFGGRQTALNSATTAFAFALNVAIGIWFTPFLVHEIGPESYGLVMLAAVVISFGGPLVQAVSTTLVRAFAFAKSEGGADEVVLLLNRSMNLCARIAVLIAFAVALIGVLGPRLLGIAPGFRGEASAILLLTGLSFVLFVFQAPFAAILYTQNRIDVGNHAQVLQTLVRVLGAVALLELVAGWPVAVPLAGLAGSVSFLVLVCWASRTVTKWRVIPSAIFHAPAIQFGGTGASVLLGTIASMLLTATELLVVNYMSDEAATGMYAATIQIAVLLRAAMLTMSSVFGPRIITHYAQGDRQLARRSTGEAMEILGLIAALPAGIVLVASPLILTIWLGPSYTAYANILRIECLGTLALVTGLPLQTFCLAANRVLAPSLVRMVAAVGYVVLAAVLFRSTQLGVAGVAVSLAAAIVGSELVFAGLYAARVADGDLALIMKPIMVVAAGLATSVALTWLALEVWIPDSLLELCLFGTLIAVGHLAVSLLLVGRAVIEAFASTVVRRWSSSPTV